MRSGKENKGRSGEAEGGGGVGGGHMGSESSEMGERRLVVEGKEDCDVPVTTGSRALEGIAVDA